MSHPFTLPDSLQEYALLGVLVLIGARCLPSFTRAATEHLRAFGQLSLSALAAHGFGVSMLSEETASSSSKDAARAVSRDAEEADESPASSSSSAAGSSPPPPPTSAGDFSQSAAIQEKLKSMRKTPSPASTFTGNVPGLWNNGGNWCFLNATLQALAGLQNLPFFLASIQQLASSLDEPLPPLSTALLQTLHALNPTTSSRTVLRPSTVAQALASSGPGRSGLLNLEQQDAQELFVVLLDACTEELGRLDRIAKQEHLVVPGLEEVLHRTPSREVTIQPVSMLGFATHARN